jgi:hypothetical protein
VLRVVDATSVRAATRNLGHLTRNARTAQIADAHFRLGEAGKTRLIRRRSELTAGFAGAGHNPRAGKARVHLVSLLCEHNFADQPTFSS